MSKETFYFPHDYNARTDRKLVNLIMKHGMTGIGVYWCVVEMLYEEGGYLPFEYERISFELRTEYEVVRSVILDFDLFKMDVDNFWSNAVLDRLKARFDKSEKARISASNRWSKCERNANAMRPHEDRNAIKERKGKENKVKERIKEHSLNLREPVDNSTPAPTAEPALIEKPKEEKPEPKDVPFGDFDPSKKPLLENLKSVTEKIAIYYPEARTFRQVTLFVESNISGKHPDAILHCLKSLLIACENKEVIEYPRAYMESALKIEDGKYNAADSEARCNEFKQLPKGVSTLGQIMQGATKDKLIPIKS